MTTRITIAWILILGSAFAQTPITSPQPVPDKQTAPATPQSKIDPAKEADIRQLMDVIGVSAIMVQMMERMSTTLKPLMTQALPAGDYRDQLVDLFFVKFQSKADTQQLLDQIVPLYDKYLSAQEVKDLIHFYQSPLGQKTVKVMPMLIAEAQEVGRKWGEGLGRQSMIEVLTEHPELQKALENAKKPADPK
jgi:uncharacterized protein